MKKLLLLVMCLIQLNQTYAALKNGDDASDFSVVDINGASFSLYSRMGASRSACLDFFATWCGPCWSFHQSGVLDQVYTNLSSETVVVMLESDFSTNTNCIYGPSGCVGGTQGNWAAGTHYPIVDLSGSNGGSVPSEYNITYYPTLYVISPDKRVWNITSRTYSNYSNWITKSFKLVATGAVTHSLCGDNGRIILNTTGGLGALSYEWSNGATTKDLINIPGGTYKVTITDQNGYYKEFGPYVVNGPSQRVAIVDQQLDHIKCWNENTGEIEITADYGTPGYRYAWSNGQNTAIARNLKAGVYTITVTDANNCTITKNYTLNEPADLKLKARTTTDECDKTNGTILADGQGGILPYLFDIGQGQQNSVFFEDLPGGSYELIVTDANDCEEKLTVVVPKTFAPIAEAGQSKPLDCIHDTLTLDGANSSFGPNFTYLWTTKDGRIIKNADQLTAEVDLPGLYHLKITDITNGCISTDSVKITDHRVYPDIEATGDGSINCRQNERLISGRSNSKPIKYFWTKLQETFKDTSRNISVSSGGKYVFNVLDTINQCVSKDTVSIMEDKQKPNISVATIDDLNCLEHQRIIDASLSDQGMTIRWETNNGNIVSGANTLQPTIDKPATYRLILTNEVNGCLSVFDVDVKENIEKPVSDPGQAKDISCIISQVELDASNSSRGSQFSYLWNTSNGHIVSGANTLKPIISRGGDYSLLVKNLINHCENTSNIKILEQTEPNSAYTQVVSNLEVAFKDESMGVPKSWQWNFGDGNTSQQQNPVHTYGKVGEYEVCLEIQNDCGTNKKCKNILLTNSGGILVLSNWEIHNVSCFGGNDGYININVDGGVPPYTYAWSNGSTNKNISQLISSDYEIIITDNVGTSLKRVLTVRQPQQIEVNEALITNTPAGSSNGSIDLKVKGGVPAYTYLWSNGQTSAKIDNLTTGTYWCDITDQNACIKKLGPFEVKEIVGTFNPENNILISVSPNPLVNEGFIKISFDKTIEFQLEIINSLGQSHAKVKDKAKEYLVPVSRRNMVSGVYYVVLKTDQKTVVSKWMIN